MSATGHGPLSDGEGAPFEFLLAPHGYEGTMMSFHVCAHCQAMYLGDGDGGACPARHKTMGQAVDEAHADNLRWLAECEVTDTRPVHHFDVNPLASTCGLEVTVGMRISPKTEHATCTACKEILARG